MPDTQRCSNIPIFIPHLGCPNDCVFCNQRTISGVEDFDPEKLGVTVDEVLSTLPQDTRKQIAFFGGSFTGIGDEKMVALLTEAQRYVDRGLVESIRLSTRPDYINRHILDILSKYSVSVIELGIQSMSDDVLRLSRRGHSSSDTVMACKLVLEYGFELVGQMMIGLPGSDSASELETAEFICSVGADGARVYPIVVFKGTELCRMAECGEYSLPMHDEMISRTASVLDIFDRNRVKCIRVGLCASENLASPEHVWGGASDAAIGEMAMSELFMRRILSCINGRETHGKKLFLQVPMGCTSRAIGHRGINKVKLTAKYGIRQIKITESKELFGYEIKADITD